MTARPEESLSHRVPLIKRDIQHRYVHPGFAEKAEIGSLGRLYDDLIDLIDRNVARSGHAFGLQIGVRGTDVRVQT